MSGENRSPKGSILSWGLPLVISLSYVYLSVQRDLRLSIPVLIGTTAFVVMLLAVLLYAGEREQLHLSPGLILFFALFFRLLFVFRAPELSDDVYRYLWDGLQTLRGINPYGLPPTLARLSDGNSAVLLEKINHPEMVTIYPPVSQMVFAVGAAITHSLTGMKILMATLDIAICVITLKLLDTLGLPAWRGALYAWHPLPIIEIAGSGHIDGAGILFLLATLLMHFRQPFRNVSAASRRVPLSNSKSNSFMVGLAFAASILVKFIPLIYLPVLFLADRKRMFLLFGLSMGLLLFCLPFVSDIHHMLSTLGTYLQHWEFSNFLFRTLRSLTSSGNCARLILCSLLTASIAFLFVSFRLKRSSIGKQESFRLLLKAIYGVTFVFLLFTPTLYPWYALYLVALFPFAIGPAGLVLSWVVFLSYGVLIDYTLTGRWIENDVVAAAIWLSPVMVFLMSRLVDRTLARKCKAQLAL